MRLKIEIGSRYGMLTVIEEAEKFILPSGQTNRAMLCKCDCGKNHIVRVSHLTRGNIKSCGCINKTVNGKCKTFLYRAWNSMRHRCSDTYVERRYYFDKGIKICDEWANDFFAFESWANSVPYSPGMQLDRIDGKKGYSPDNCRFVTARENNNNRCITFFVEYNGVKEPFMPLIDRLGKSKYQGAIRGRINRGWSAQKAIDTPIRQGNYKRNEANRFIGIYK